MEGHLVSSSPRVEQRRSKALPPLPDELKTPIPFQRDSMRQELHAILHDIHENLDHPCTHVMDHVRPEPSLVDVLFHDQSVGVPRPAIVDAQHYGYVRPK